MIDGAYIFYQTSQFFKKGIKKSSPTIRRCEYAASSFVVIKIKARYYAKLESLVGKYVEGKYHEVPPDFLLSFNKHIRIIYLVVFHGGFFKNVPS